jgi:hypothetical protein
LIRELVVSSASARARETPFPQPTLQAYTIDGTHPGPKCPGLRRYDFFFSMKLSCGPVEEESRSLNPCVVQLFNHCPQKAIAAKAIAAVVKELGDTYLHCDAASASFDSTASFVSMARTIGSTQSAADWSKSWLRIPSARARGCYELAHENDKIRPPSLPPHLLIRKPTLTPPSLQHRPPGQSLIVNRDPLAATFAASLLPPPSSLPTSFPPSPILLKSPYPTRRSNQHTSFPILCPLKETSKNNWRCSALARVMQT